MKLPSVRVNVVEPGVWNKGFVVDGDATWKNGFMQLATLQEA